MRDYTGLDSLLSPLFCLVVMVTVWAVERCLPGRDILFFIPKSWRDTQPLYQLTDEQALQDTQADMMMPAVDSKDPAVAPAGFEIDGSITDDGLKKGGSAAAGRRPRLADDSAHAGRQMFASKTPL
jgi:hypothetical protein